MIGSRVASGKRLPARVQLQHEHRAVRPAAGPAAPQPDEQPLYQQRSIGRRLARDRTLGAQSHRETVRLPPGLSSAVTCTLYRVTGRPRVCL